MQEADELRQQYLECGKPDVVAVTIEELHRTKRKNEGNRLAKIWVWVRSEPAYDWHRINKATAHSQIHVRIFHMQARQVQHLSGMDF